mgnify:CR=1 FL=1
MVTSTCFNCKESIESHDSQKMTDCLSVLSEKIQSLEKNLNTKKTVLQVPDEEEAIEYFTRTKSGEPSRMGSN